MRSTKRRLLWGAAATAIALACASPASAAGSDGPGSRPGEGRSGLSFAEARNGGHGVAHTPRRDNDGPRSQHEEVFRLLAEATQVSPLDLNPDGDQGDEIVVSGGLFEDDETVGTFGEVCTVTGTGTDDDFDLQCVVTFTLDEGQITVQGRFPVTSTGAMEEDLAITGGTGAFRNAGGYIHAENISEVETEITVHLIRNGR